jgi:hypothetical protein
MTTTTIILNFDRGIWFEFRWADGGVVDQAIHWLPSRLFGFVLPLSLKIWK